jgi:hypothetical protein
MALALLERSSSETSEEGSRSSRKSRSARVRNRPAPRAIFFTVITPNSKLFASWRIARAGPGNGLRLVEGILFFPLAFGQRARLRAHRAHRSTRPAPVATPQPQKQWPLSAPPLPSSPPAPRSPGTSSIAPARAFPGRERVGSGNVSSSDARAARCRDRSSSRAAAPHARATSRLTAPSPSPAPPSTANSPPRPRTRLASPSACARRYVRPALERHPRPDGSFSISRRASSRRASSRDRGDARKHPASLASIAQRTCASPSPLTAASPFPTATGRSRSRGEGSRGEEARAHRPPPRLQGETLAVTRFHLFRGRARSHDA